MTTRHRIGLLVTTQTKNAVNYPIPLAGSVNAPPQQHPVKGQPFPSVAHHLCHTYGDAALAKRHAHHPGPFPRLLTHTHLGATKPRSRSFGATDHS